MANKILKLNEAIKTVEILRGEGKSIVLAGGCFDLLHPGHLFFLEKAKKAGDVLLILLESDEKIKKLKGEERPITPQKERAKSLASLEAVDFVILLPPIWNDWGYFELVRKISPTVIAITEGDPKQKQKEKQAKEVGGKVIVVTPRLKEYSTTKLLS